MAGTANSGGRNAKSTASHLLRGTFRDDRHGDHETPDAPAGPPVPPRPLAGIARAEWHRMVARLTKTGAISTVDDAALYQYVQLFAETEDIMRDLAESRKAAKKLQRAAEKLDGSELVTAIGRIVDLHGLVAKSKTSLRQGHLAIRQYLIEFGMTPSARTRVKLPAKKPQSKIEQFMKAHA